ncbi:putative ADP-ribosylation factor GTPase-activating protein AGD14-like isoform X2 [Hibiscus syriacus]|uniref:ADP-ribosylation factor GTPase-activating protein AGD14-like isoform X2 n=1 Tax=Hibiscus syriacus TaxID=106335 RepID=A0A6A2X227_HIBSY|nr:probable ADP-ribosylation factor GTPase-activating protein AGD14 [Hibiscus syriacus]KAE8668842.1 putative ADP-ribosylation factor GTPase-activating protein AGD14-like isoform X2 [Hibiscus syriacus]
MGSRKEEERNEKIIRGLMKLPPNRRCINCNSLGPQYVCTNFWTFICMTCSGIHREFTHRVKSVSMSKFTSQEVEALQNGGNQRARDIYLKDWDLQRQRLPDSSNADKIRDFIKNVYVDRKYAGGKTHDKPPRDMQSHRNHEDEMRRASSYHSYSQSPPYDYQYEDRRYGKQVAAALSRKPGSDRGHYMGKVSSFVYSPGHLSDQMFDDRFANEGSAPRVSDFSVSSGGDPFASGRGSPNFRKNVGFASPTFQSQIDVSSEDTHHQMINPSLDPSSHKDAGGVPPPQSSVPVNYGGLDLFNTPEASASLPIDLFQLPAISSVSSKDLLQPAAVSSTPPGNLDQPPPSIDLFAGIVEQQPATSFDGKSSELPVPKNEGWATFDSPQPAASDPVTKNLLPALMPSDEDLSVKFDQPSSLNTTVQWLCVENYSAFRDRSTMSSQWQEGHDGQTSTVATGTQSWNAFNDFAELLPVGPQVVTYNHLASTDEHLGLAVSENHDNDGIQKADSQSGFAAATVPSENGIAPSYAPSMNPLLGEKESHAANHKSTNPFDVPYDSELEQNDMFFDISSIKATLPNAHLPSPFLGGVPQPWLPQNPATPSSQLPNVPAQEPVASIGGNPFA